VITIDVSPDDGDPYEVTAKTRDLLTWEKAQDGRSAQKFETGNATLADLYEVAWVASKRQGLFTGSQKKFEESVDVGNARRSPTGENPTQKGR